MYYQIDGTSTRILGSVHVYPKVAPPPPARIAEAYEWAQALCIEHDHAQVAPFMALPPGSDLEATISPEAWSALIAHWPPSEDIARLRALKLWAAFVSVAQSVVDGEPGVEAALAARAVAAGKPVYWLEEGAEVASFLDRMPHELLARTVALNKNPTAAREQFRALHEAWVTGDGVALSAVLAAQPISHIPELYEPMFTARNRMWAERIPAIAQRARAPFLFVLGVGHLAGPGNLIDLLRARGVGVTSMM